MFYVYYVNIYIYTLIFTCKYEQDSYYIKYSLIMLCIFFLIILVLYTTILTPVPAKTSLVRFSLINGEVRQFQFVARPSRLPERVKCFRHGSAPNTSGISFNLLPIAFIVTTFGYDDTVIPPVPYI